MSGLQLIELLANIATIIGVGIVWLIFQKQAAQSRDIAAAQEQSAQVIHEQAVAAAQGQEMRELLGDPELAEHARVIGDVLTFTGTKTHWEPGNEAVALRRLAFIFKSIDANRAGELYAGELRKGNDPNRFKQKLYDYLELFNELLGHFHAFEQFGLQDKAAIVVYRGAWLLVTNSGYADKDNINRQKFRRL